ncbi:ATP-binding protein [Niabella sp. CC-SYL272]|uniref:tetratricopeptide repeat-containing sensor histidine kinase n=1 Tax=Niabella agricola TaxID=2891571 RepID=UPI001F460FF9|nr:tetratricopeptide repeat-containing sensor histidine kinase [Niabella agricola]MCF3110245.1 ATP-binding protein [Niabella agricola]
MYTIKDDSAFYYFNKVTTNTRNLLEAANAYTYMGILQSNFGDYFSAQENVLTSIRYLQRMNHRKEKDSIDKYMVNNYNELGRISSILKNYPAAIVYYDQALKLIKEDSKRIITLNNKAVAHRQMKQYPQAIAIYDSIINGVKDNPQRYARFLTNSAYTRWLQDPGFQVAPDLLRALQIREKEKDTWGQYSSYSHLSDYYSRTQPGLALSYAQKMYTVVQQLGNPGYELEALQKLIILSPPAALKKYFTRYQYLNDSLQTARSSTRNQFALIRYDVEKSKADNLVLQKANAKKRVQIIGQWILLLGVTVLTVIGFAWYRKQKQRAIREHQLKTSQKVHDVVANGLYRVISKVDYDKTGGKEQLLDELTSLYEQSRNISYEPHEEKTALAFNESLTELISSFSSPETRVLIVGNSKELWSPVTPGVKKELERVLQELMVNMKKHSRAKNVVLKFDRQPGQLSIQYTDDGIGAPPHFRKGNGLRNTENRMAGIGGRIIFDTATATGMKIQLYIPIALPI